MEKFIIKDDKLIIQTIAGTQKRIIKIDEIESYEEVKKEDEDSTWKDLTIFTKNSNYKISSSSNTNYHAIKRKLIKGKKKNKYAQQVWESKSNRNRGVSSIIIGMLFLLFFSMIYSNKNLEIQAGAFAKIEGTVANKIEVKKNRDRGHSISIELEEYPNFEFKLGENEIKATKKNQLISNVKIGEQVQLKILEEQFKKNWLRKYQ